MDTLQNMRPSALLHCHFPQAIYSHSVTSHLVSWKQHKVSLGNELLNTARFWAYLASEAPRKVWTIRSA